MESSEQQLESDSIAATNPENEQSSPGREAASSSENPNPFWSQRVIDEFRIRQARPLGLAEYDEQEREPEYFGSENGQSLGFASAAGLSVRASSPIPAKGSETSSDSRRSNAAVSNAPSVTSRSRSPTREEIPAIRDLLVSLGSAVAGLAEEQRQTRQRLSVVEEIRSGSTSSMRTGREVGEQDSGNVVDGDLGVGPQVFQIGDADPEEGHDMRSGVLPLEDWVQAPVKIGDIPPEGSMVTAGMPEVFGPPEAFGNGLGFPSAQVGARRDSVGIGGLSAQAGARQDIVGIGLPSAQVGARQDIVGIGLPSAQVGARQDIVGIPRESKSP